MRPRVRVAYVSSYSTTRITGIGRFIHDLAREIRQSGGTAFTICPGEPSEPSDSETWCIRLSWPRLKDLELALKTALCLVRARRSYDLIHAHQAHLQSVASATVARILGRPVVVTFHLRAPTSAERVRHILRRATEFLALAVPTAAVAVSRAVAETLRRPSMPVIENGVDVTAFKPSPLLRAQVRKALGIEHEFVFLFAGRWARVKGLDVLLQAVRSPVLNGVPFRLVVVGEPAPDEPAFLEQCLARFGQDPRIAVLGFVPRPEEYMNAADVFVLPSRNEGMPLVFLEALATGLPVLASDIPVHRRIAEEDGCAWTFRSEDSEDLSRKMRDIIKAGVPRSVRDRARNLALSTFDLSHMALKYRQLYVNALVRTGAKRTG